MSRRRDIAELTEADPRFGARGISGDLDDRIITFAIDGVSPNEIVAALGSVTLRDGFSERPIAVADIAEVCAFVRAATLYLGRLEREAAELNAKVDRLRTLLTPVAAS